jgi:UDP-glucose:(heptosyl)LPS alpha-1,3-glucosyltransferase
LRLAVVSPFVDRRHGTERALAELLERLASEYRCEVHLYAQSVEDLPVSDPKSAQTAESGGIFWHQVPSIPGPHVAQFIGWMFMNGFLRSWDTIFGGSSYDLVLSPGINCLHPDVVIVHALFHRLQELAREDRNAQLGRGSFFRHLHRRVYYALLTRMERRIFADEKVTLAAVSQRTADLLNEYFHRKDVCVIPNGVDTAHFSPAARLARRAEARKRRGLRDEDFVLLLIGNDWRVKGLPVVLDAIAALPAVPVRLLVVGCDAAESFRVRAIQLGVQDRCLWELPRPDVVDFYAAADVYVSPSREDSYGLPVAEAMACGLPAITSVFAGVAEFIHDGLDGFVVQDPLDPRTLPKLIQLLYSDPGVRRNMGEVAARNALAWTWDRNAEAIWELLRDLAMRARISRV